MMWHRPPKQMGCASCLLTVLALKLWLIGCTLIGYMAWVLATSVTIRQFMSGQLVFSYGAIGAGFILFTTGLFGWVGATSGSSCVIRTYCAAAVLSIGLEISGILALNIMRFEMSDVIGHGWEEVNQATRNSIQRNLGCCGYDGPKEFAYKNDPIDDSCYREEPESPLTAMTSPDASLSMMDNATVHNGRQLIQNGCGNKLKDWFANNQVIWIAIVVGIAVIEVLGVATSICIVNGIKQERRNVELLIDPENGSRHRFMG